MLTCKALRSLFLCSLVFVCATQKTFAESSPILETELQGFIAAAKESDVQLRNVVEKLEWAGLSDPRLFDIVAARLQENYTDSTKPGIEFNAWLTKGLAYSGNPEYQSLLTTVSQSNPHKKLRRHVENSLRRLPDYQNWNPIIANNNHLAKSPEELEKMRTLNLLRADIPELIRAGTQRIYRQHLDDAAMIKEVNSLLLANYNEQENGVKIDALSWMCRTLAASGDSQYKATLAKIANDKGAHKKIRKYAKKYLTSQ